MNKNYDHLELTEVKWGEKFPEVLGNIILALLKEDNVCKIDYQMDIVGIDFNHDENISHWGSPELMWLTPEEARLIEKMRIEEESQED